MIKQKMIEDIVLETNKHCFLCWGQVSDHVSSSSTYYPIHHLSQLLKLDGINLNKVVSGNIAPSQRQHYLTHTPVKGSRSRLKATLCEECSKLNAKISELFQQLRKIEMEAIFYLTLIHGKLCMMTHDKKNGKGVPCGDHLKEGDLEGFVLEEKLEIAKRLRMEAMEKCSQKLKCVHPRIKIRKLNGPQLPSEKLKLKRKFRIRAPKHKPNYEDCDWSDSEIIDISDERESAAANANDGAQGDPGVIHLNDLIWEDISRSKKFVTDTEHPTKTQIEFDDHPPSKTGFEHDAHKLSIEGRSYPCKFCQRSFSQSSNRKRHMKRYCLKRKCPGKVVPEPPKVEEQKLYEIVAFRRSSQNTVGHWKNQCSVDPKSGRHQCKLCPKVYASPVSFQRHYRVVHRSVIKQPSGDIVTPTEPDVTIPDTATNVDCGDDGDSNYCTNLSPINEDPEMNDAPHSTDLISTTEVFNIASELSPNATDAKSCVPADSFAENRTNVETIQTSFSSSTELLKDKIVNPSGRGFEAINIKPEPTEPNGSVPGQVDDLGVASEESVPMMPISSEKEGEAVSELPLPTNPDVATSKPYKLRRRQKKKKVIISSLDSGDDDNNDDAGSNYSANLSPHNGDSEDSPEPEPPSNPEAKPKKSKSKKRFRSAGGSNSKRNRQSAPHKVRNAGMESWSIFNPENGKNKCTLCPTEFTGLREIRKHFRTVHLKKPERRRRHKCSICGMTFLGKSNLNYHHRRVHLGQHIQIILKGDADGPFPCPHCGRTFTWARNLLQHVKAVHQNLKSHVCDQCGKGFITLHRLQTHISGVHFLVKRFVCEDCGKRFHTNSNLQRHRGQVHLGKRENICEQCGNSFAQPSTLKTHIKLAHSEQYDFGCDLCDKRFKLKMYMQQHRRSAHKSIEEEKPRQMEAPGAGDVAKNEPELANADQTK